MLTCGEQLLFSFYNEKNVINGKNNMDLQDVREVVNSEGVAALSLSKGGWEGWLQCQLWAYLSLTKKQTVEREVLYPNSRQRCDLVVGFADPKLWVELKAFGIFRTGDEEEFLNSIAYDVLKLKNRPNGSTALVLVILPKVSSEWFETAIEQGRWNGFEKQEEKYVNLYYMTQERMSF
ncbi:MULTISPECIES: hypothetical protein [unclassified Moorena]|uniref:hypothetical protein n=1 Tax=unclassified Moorena TaxID=2683338 RepID=UPI0014002513|nr:MULTISPECIES: hypothetical protein [unclassified Moorena]NEO15398.1 hypothetical protein [Moorena sp. SIO3E8]NEQ01100.1 hypothetical protein [Moorena sp. SIO3F7]